MSVLDSSSVNSSHFQAKTVPYTAHPAARECGSAQHVGRDVMRDRRDAVPLRDDGGAAVRHQDTSGGRGYLHRFSVRPFEKMDLADRLSSGHVFAEVDEVFVEARFGGEAVIIAI